MTQIRPNQLVRVSYMHIELGEKKEVLSGLMPRYIADRLVLKLQSREPKIIPSQDYEH